MQESEVDYWMVTIVDYEGAFEHTELANFNVRRTKDRLRKQIVRTGFEGPIFGSVELDYHDSCKLWLPHAHLVVPITKNNCVAKSNLEKMYARKNLKHIKQNRKAIPLNFDKVNHEQHQISYCFKLSFFEVVDVTSRKGNRYTKKKRLDDSLFCDSLRLQNNTGRRAFIFSFGDS
ncbi:hypothetical protein L4D00_05720 [Photobacterium swingsii]|uniref:hypothetical protein n=1 Tax=Photobacterium swingsii TaxID=680026 RepID=UPI003D0D62BC